MWLTAAASSCGSWCADLICKKTIIIFNLEKYHKDCLLESHHKNCWCGTIYNSRLLYKQGIQKVMHWLLNQMDRKAATRLCKRADLYRHVASESIHDSYLPTNTLCVILSLPPYPDLLWTNRHAIAIEWKGSHVYVVDSYLRLELRGAHSCKGMTLSLLSSTASSVILPECLANWCTAWTKHWELKNGR